jgi:hypothetical protein
MREPIAQGCEGDDDVAILLLIEGAAGQFSIRRDHGKMTSVARGRRWVPPSDHGDSRLKRFHLGFRMSFGL